MMLASFTARRLKFVALLTVISFLLIFVIAPSVPAEVVLRPAAATGPCDHILKPAANGSGPTVECFLNATATWTFEPNTLSVPTNATVVFSVGNIGGVGHTFTLDSVANDTNLVNWTANPSVVSATTLSAYFAKHTAVNLNLTSAGPFVSPAVSFSNPHGVYYYVCLIPGHFQSGMFGELYLGLAPKTPTVTPALTLPIQTGILIVAFIVMAAAALLIFNAQSLGSLRKGLTSLATTDQGTPYSLRSWIFTTDHKRVGILYFVTAIYFFFVAGTFAMMMRTQLRLPDNNFVNAEVYNQLVSMHGLLMALFVLSPLGFAFANYILPLQIGAKDMSFPRLNALSYWFYLFGGLLLLSGIFLPGGAISSGWTLYAPLTETPYLPQPGMDVGILGILMLCASVILGTLNIATTVARQRAKGYRLIDLPMFSWSVLFTLAMMWLAFPDLAAAVTLLTMDRMLGSVIFLSSVGGTLLWQQVFWFFGHPEVYILIFPAFGAMYDIASVFSGRPIFGKRYVIYSMAAIVVLSTMVWLHHMFMTGVNLGWLDIQSITTGAISIPSDTLVLGLIFTITGGKIRYRAPMLFTMGAIPLFIIGGVTGVLTSVPALDVAFHGTYWVVGHFHYMLAGTALWGLTAATYFWFPKVTGRMYNETIARLHFVVAAIGINTLYFPMLLLYNMPRRYFVYSASFGFDQLNLIATIGGYIYGTAQAIFLINLIYSVKRGPVASRNPWGAWGFEWLTTSPPPDHNFDGNPVVRGDKMLIEPSTDHPHAPRLSKWPLFVGLGSMGTLFGLVVYLYWGSLALLAGGLVLLLAAVIGWAREDYDDLIPSMDHGTRELGPFGSLSNVQLGTLIFITGDIAFFGAMVGGYLFATWQAPYFNDPLTVLSKYQSSLYNGLLVLSLLASILMIYIALWAAKARNLILAEAGVVATMILGGVFLGATLMNWQYMTNAGMGLSTIDTNLSTSMFYDFSILHILHILALLAVLAYFAVRLPKIVTQPDPNAQAAVPGVKVASPFDGLTAAAYLWSFVALFGLILIGVFWLA